MTTKPDLSLRLALATGPCLCTPKKGCAECVIRGLHDQEHTHEGCTSCHGTGRVPWLKGVRVICPKKQKRHWHETIYFAPGTCSRWTVSEDTEAWLEAGKPEMLKREWVLAPSNDGWRIGDIYELLNLDTAFAEAPTVKEALQLALEKVVPQEETQ